MRQSNLSARVGIYFALTLLSLIFIFPTAFMLISSFKVNEMQILGDMTSIKGFIPYGEMGLQNYKDVFKNMDFIRFFLNSVLITGSTITLGFFVNSSVAFSLARLKFKGRNLILTIIVALIVIPIESLVIPMLLMVNRWGMVDTYIVQILPFIADPFYIYLYYQFFIGLPRSLDEAVIIDGGSYFRLYWQFTLPLSKPIIVTVIILSAIARWGEFLWPLMTTRGAAYRPLTVAMQQLFTLNPRMWGDIFAFASMTTIPLLVLFLIFQRHFVGSIAATGIKG